MRNQLIASLLVVSFAGAANASEVTNSYSNEISTGSSNLQVHNIRSEVGTFNGVEKTLKMETYGGTTNISTVKFDGVNLSGTGYSANQVVVDPVAIGAYSENTVKSNFSDVQTVNLTETSNFTRTTNSHTVSAEN